MSSAYTTFLESSVLNTIEYAYLLADIGRVTNTVRYSGDLILIDTDGNRVTNSYLSCSSTTATAVIPVYKYRDVPIGVTYRYGFFNSSNCDVTVEPASIRIRGEADAVDAVALSYEIDEKTISEDVSYNFGISLPAGVQNLNAVDSVSVSVRPRGMSTKTVYLYSITVIKPDNPSLSYEDLSQRPIAIRLCGETASLASVTAASVKAVVDLSAQSGTGTVEAPLSM